MKIVEKYVWLLGLGKKDKLNIKWEVIGIDKKMGGYRDK